MQATIGPLVWLLLSEIFPLKIRSLAIGISVLVLWLSNAVVVPRLPASSSRASGIAPTFFIFVVLGLLALAFIGNCVPETRGRSLEELEDQFRAQYS